MSEQIQTAGNAVRWATRYYGDRPDFTAWHFAGSTDSTGCGRRVPAGEDLLALETAHASRTNCHQCLCRHEVREVTKGQA